MSAAVTRTTTQKTGTALSGLQKEVLALYRTTLRAAFSKDQNTANDATSFVRALHDGTSNTGYAKKEFARQAQSMKKNDFRTIEFKIRHGYKQVKLLQMPGVVKILGGGGGGGKV